MEKLNREVQRRILEALRDEYPSTVNAQQLGFDQKDPTLRANTAYLEEHGLISTKTLTPMSGPGVVVNARITARGIDFLQDDGGLSAVLGVVTVRFEAETLRALLTRHIEQADLSAGDKSRIKSLLQTLGTEALKTATTRLLEEGLDRWPHAIAWLQTLRAPAG